MRFEPVALVGNSPDFPLHSTVYTIVGLEMPERLLFQSVLDGDHTDIAGIEPHGTG